MYPRSRRNVTEFKQDSFILSPGEQGIHNNVSLARSVTHPATVNVTKLYYNTNDGLRKASDVSLEAKLGPTDL